MDRRSAGGMVAELLFSIMASLMVALLVLASGAAIEDATVRSAVLTASALESPPTSRDTFGHLGIQGKDYLCCALIYADPGLSQ